MPRVHAAQPHGRAPVQRVRLLEVWRLRPAQQLAATRVPRMSSVTRWLQGDARQGGGEAKAQAAAWEKTAAALDKTAATIGAEMTARAALLAADSAERKEAAGDHKG